MQDSGGVEVYVTTVERRFSIPKDLRQCMRELKTLRAEKIMSMLEVPARHVGIMMALAINILFCCLMDGTVLVLYAGTSQSISLGVHEISKRHSCFNLKGKSFCMGSL